jgi:hypothetical protein
MDGKRFSVDVKCEDLVMVQFDGPTLFVSNEHPFGDESFLRRLHVVCVDRAQADNVEQVWVCKSKEKVYAVVEGSGNVGKMVIKKIKRQAIDRAYVTKYRKARNFVSRDPA